MGRAVLSPDPLRSFSLIQRLFEGEKVQLNDREGCVIFSGDKDSHLLLRTIFGFWNMLAKGLMV